MLLPVLAILFLATFVRSAFGFGEALVAVPLLAFVMPVELAAPLAVLVSITVAMVAIAQDWRHIHVRSAGWLVLSTLVGTPLGLLALHRMDARIVKAILAVVIMGFSGYALLGRRRAILPDDRRAWIFGFAAGVLGGAYGMNGPPLVMYGSLRGWSPQHFRATLQGYFLPASLVAFAGYGLTGLWTVTVNRYYLLALPVIVLAIFLGRAVNRRMNARMFVCYVHGGLVIVGTLLLFQSVAGARFG
ncbi:MAG: sulfite exporter TauE/SafE family protein [Rhodanobacter sp.]|nr:MAG: sulfite exporter TauE/SafE family protein [Rhodanobacter sp.]